MHWHCALLSLQPLEVFHDSVIAAERSMEMDEMWGVVKMVGDRY